MPLGYKGTKFWKATKKIEEKTGKRIVSPSEREREKKSVKRRVDVITDERTSPGQKIEQVDELEGKDKKLIDIKRDEKSDRRVDVLSKSGFQQELHESKGNIQEYKDFLYGRGTIGTFNPDDVNPFKTSAARRREIEKADTNLEGIRELEQQSYDWHPDTKIRKVKTKKGSKYVFDFPYSGAESYYSTLGSLRERDFLGLFATSFTPSDPLGLKSVYYTAVGDKQKALDVKVEAVHSTRRPFHEFYLSSPMGVIGTSYAAATGIGAGLGAVSAVSSQAGAVAGVTLGAEMTYAGASSFEKPVSSYLKTGDPGSLISHSTTSGLAIASGITGFKSGYRMGYGRVSELLYLRSTYKPGSASYIRAKNILKTSRRLQFVKSKDVSPLDFTKDIMRLDPKTSQNVMSYLEQHPRSVIGGSASQYAQTGRSLWYKYRSIKPRDIDLLLKDVSGAKISIKGSPHQVDIHGFDFGGKGGKYIRFGFETKSPVKIGDYKYMGLGEQMTRKGISSVMTETQYRWFKDIPDFKMATEQLISSGRSSWNPLNQFRSYMGSRSYDYVINPESSTSYMTAPSYTSKMFSGSTGHIAYNPPKIPVPSGGGYPSSYIYPSGVSSYGLVGLGVGSYVSSTYKSPTYKKIKYPRYKSPKTPIYKAPKSPRFKSPKTPTYKTSGYKSSDYPYPKSFLRLTIPESVFKPLDAGRQREQEFEYLLEEPRFLFRKFKVPSFEKLLKEMEI